MSKLFPNGFLGNVLSEYSSVTAKHFFVCLSSALIIGFLISVLYLVSHRKEGYSESYVVTMTMLPAIVCIILLTINSLAGALSVAGAFSLVRFRSVAGDPKDISYIFFSMAAGVACGVGYVGFAFSFFIILGIVMFVFSVINFGASKQRHMTLKITIPEDLDYQGVFDPILDKYTAFHKLRRVKTTNFGTLFELIYSVDVKDDLDQKKFIDELRAHNGNMTINLVFFRYDDKIYET
ncbi:MAG: DUF4956 domain-containing protein [Ruminococcus sp.]|nr:DUF4956 domain-containing protein [Ruminococcus sp.]